MKNWYLEGIFNNHITRIPILRLPFRVGRGAEAELTLDTPLLSRFHAEICGNGEQLAISDLDSTNGTYVNSHQIYEEHNIRHGDVIHLAESEFRLIDGSDRSKTPITKPQPKNQTEMAATSLHFHRELPQGVLELEELLEQQLIEPAFQEIVTRNGTIYGYEVLGRGTHPLLPKSPGPLFQIAESIGLEVELSELMRQKGLQRAAEQQLGGKLYVNTHPKEMNNYDRLLGSLKAAHRTYPDTTIMLEIHEQTITDGKFVSKLKSDIALLSMELAFDDFGVGQSRLLELIEATPHVLKFDLQLINTVHQAPAGKISLIKKLLGLANELNITCLAECVSNEDEYRACMELGFDLFQGFYLGKPRPII